VKIFLQVFLSPTFPGLDKKNKGVQHKVCQTNHYATLNYIHPNLIFAKIQAWGIDFHKNISCHVATLYWLSLPLRHAQFAKTPIMLVHRLLSKSL